MALGMTSQIRLVVQNSRAHLLITLLVVQNTFDYLGGTLYIVWFVIVHISHAPTALLASPNHRDFVYKILFFSSIFDSELQTILSHLSFI